MPSMQWAWVLPGPSLEILDSFGKDCCVTGEAEDSSSSETGQALTGGFPDLSNLTPFALFSSKL